MSKQEALNKAWYELRDSLNPKSKLWPIIIKLKAAIDMNEGLEREQFSDTYRRIFVSSGDEEDRTSNYKAAIKSFIKKGKVEEAMEAVDALATHALHIGMQYIENCNQSRSDFDDMVQRQKEGAKVFAKEMNELGREISKKASVCCNNGNGSSFSSILKEMQELYEKKNHDYGNSFSETIQEFGFTPAIARINDKLKRVKQMVKGEQMQVNESMRDNLIDIANYCVLTIAEIDNQTNKSEK